MAPAIIAAVIVSAVSAVTAGIELTHQPKAPAAPNPLATQTQQSQAQQAAALAQAQALQRRRGLASTTLTSPLGTSGPAQTQQATLGT